MKTRKQFWITIIFLCFTHQMFSQPYYYYHGTGKETSGPVISPEFWRFNFQTNTKELFYSDSAYSGGGIVSWNPTQQWIFLTHDNSYAHMNPDDYYMSTGVVNAGSRNIVHVFPDQYPHPPGTFPHSFDDHFEDDKIVYDGIFFNPVKIVFYVTWCLPYPDTVASYLGYFAYQRTVVYDATTFSVLDTLPVPPGWITAQSSVSDDGDYLYLEKWEGGYPIAIGKYSLATKQLIINRSLNDIVVPGIRKGFADSKKGKYLIGYCYPKPQSSDGKYALYNIDLDTSVIIPFQQEAHGSISSDGKYVIVEETPLKPNYLELRVPADELFDHPGRISVFNGVTGNLIQKLSLPPDGKVLVFDNYPNMLYYYLPNEQRSINIDLSKLSTISSLSPSSAFAGTCPFTLTVKGKNFALGSTVNWGGAAKTTTFVADSILQANISTSDIAVIDSPLVTVKNPDGSESNGIRFYIRPSPSVPSITLLSQNLALPNNQGFTLVAVGSGYDSTSNITWNTTIRTTQYISPKQLRATILDANVSIAGTATVAIEYQNCITSAPVPFSIATVPYTVLVDSLASKKHQCYNLGWLKESRVEKRLDRKLDRARQLLQMAATWPPKPPKIDLLDDALRGFREDEEECLEEYGRDIMHEIPQGVLEEGKLKGCMRVEQELGYKRPEGKMEKLTESQWKELYQETFFWMAKKVLESFVREIEILNRISERGAFTMMGKKQYITSEAYAVLKYNAQYVIDQLPEKKKK